MSKDRDNLPKSNTVVKDRRAAAKKGPSRRALLKAGGALLGGAAGAGAITGFPTIWAQEIKDIELRHVGVSYSVVKAIGDQAAKDLGFKVTMQNLDTSAAINRFITQPDSVDIADVEGWQSKLATKRGVLQGIEVKKIKEFDNILPIFTKGELEGHKIPRQGISPYEAMYITKPSDTELHDGVTDYMTFLPQVYNADSIGYRPDLVGHEVTEWKELLDPKFKGKAAILDVPAIGIMDAALCFESADLIKYGNKGNMTKKEIDFTADKLIELKKSGHFRATWTTFDQSVQLMAAGEVIIQSMWSPAVAAVRVKEIPCIYAPVNVKNGKEGYRGFPAASSSACRSPAPPSPSRACCCSMSRCPRWTSSCASKCARNCATCSASSASPSFTSPTRSSKRSRSPTLSW